MVPPTAFEVETLNFATLPPPDREAVMAFARQTGELQRDSLATRHYSEPLATIPSHSPLPVDLAPASR